MRTYRVTVQDLRPASVAASRRTGKLAKFTKTFQAADEQDAWNQAYQDLGGSENWHICEIKGE
jgi:ribosomal protein L20A (L18A)